MRRTRRAALGAVVVLVTAAAAAPAEGAVQVTADRVVVTAPQARAVVERAPYRLTVQDARGAQVLGNVANDRAAPTVGAGVDDEPGGGNALPNSGARYQPLTFEVGGQAPVEYPGTPWVGNLLLNARGGVQHSARDVVGVREVEGGAAELTLSTSDPARQVVVRLGPDGERGIRVQARVTPDGGVSAIADSFTTPATERFQGFGGRHDELDQRGSDFHAYIEEQAQGAGPLQPVADAVPGGGKDRYLFPNGPESAFYQSASFLSDEGYSFLLGSTELARWRLATPQRRDAWQVDVFGAAMDYSVYAGSEKQALGALTEVVGRHRVPPEWALGPTLYRGIRVLSPESDTAASYERKVRADLAEYDAAKPPITSYALEGWDLMSRAQTRALVAEIRRRGLRPIAYLRAYTSPDPGLAERPQVFADALANDLLVETDLGTPYLFGSTFIAGVAGLLDFTKPKTVASWRGRVREVLDLGFDGFMQDFGEQALQGMRFADGTSGVSMHNAYPTLYHRTTRAIVDEYEREKGRTGEDRVFFFTRTGYSGRPGSPAFEASNFPGDETTDFSRSSGLGSLITDMLNRGLGGAYGYNTDIGGYADSLTGPVTKELFVRWAQAAALMPVHRVHNSSSTGTKMPWSFDDEAQELYTATAKLHAEARPLILELWREAVRTGVPVTRPLSLEHPGDPEAAEQDQQFLLGPDVLVAPVVAKGAKAREVYFPKGCWRAPETGEQVTGPASRRVDAPLDRLPYFFRCGTTPFKVSTSCASRRSFEIRLPRGARSARVTVDGRRAKVVRRGGRLRARVDLRGKKRGAYVVRVRARVRGKQVTQVRRYRTCAARRGGSR